MLFHSKTRGYRIDFPLLLLNKINGHNYHTKFVCRYQPVFHGCLPWGLLVRRQVLRVCRQQTSTTFLDIVLQQGRRLYRVNSMSLFNTTAPFGDCVGKVPM